VLFFICRRLAGGLVCLASGFRHDDTPGLVHGLAAQIVLRDRGGAGQAARKFGFGIAIGTADRPNILLTKNVTATIPV
jgi:hypothetical protein